MPGYVTLATVYVVGVATTRYVMNMEPLASASEDEVVRLVTPAVQTALSGARGANSGLSPASVATSPGSTWTGTRDAGQHREQPGEVGDRQRAGRSTRPAHRAFDAQR